MKLLEIFASHSGYRDGGHLINSTFHPECLGAVAALSSVFASIGYYVNYALGVELPVVLVIVILFILEIYTGIKASKKEGVTFQSNKFSKGWVKLLIYMIMIGCSHLLSVNMPVKPFLGFTVNIYEWLHYGFINFVIIQLFISNIENFKRIGWTEYVPFLDKLHKILQLGDKKEDEPQK